MGRTTGLDGLLYLCMKCGQKLRDDEVKLHYELCGPLEAIPFDQASNCTPDRFSDSQIGFLQNIGVRVQDSERGNQVAYNDRADKAERELHRLRCGLQDLFGVLRPNE